MSMQSSIIPRRGTIGVKVGHVMLGGRAPVVVQSMTNTDTADIAGTVEQVYQLARAGSELVRITVNTEEAARAVYRIREGPANYRIIPGNVGRGKKLDAQFASMIEIACRYDKAVRIGVNWGSMDQELVVRMMDENSKSPTPRDSADVIRDIMLISALENARRAEALGLARDRIVLSCKMSGVQDLIAVYRALAARCDYALHLGLTEAGMGSKGIVASTAALAVLLQEGIGDTIR